MSLKILYIKWVDSNVVPTWTTVDDDVVGLAEIESIGYLVHEDDDMIILAQSSMNEIKYSSMLCIPKSVILKKKIMKWT